MKSKTKWRRLKYGAINALVVIFHVAGIILADPWRAYRAGVLPTT